MRRPAQFLAALAATTGLTSAAFAAEVTDIRSGEHPTFHRVVFEADSTLEADMMPSEGVFSAIIQMPLREGQALPLLNESAARYVAEWSLVPAEGGQVRFTATLKDGMATRLYREDTLLSVDFLALETLTQTAAPAQIPMVEDYQGIRAAAQQMNSADIAAAEAAVAAAEKAAAQEAQDVQTEEPDEQAVVAGTRSRLNTMDVVLQSRPDQLQLNYEWDVVVPAAVFERAGTLWVVFENEVDIRHPGFDPETAERITDIALQQHSFGTVLRYDLAPNQSILAQRINTRWQIEIKDSLVQPRDPITMFRQVDPIEGRRAFFELGEAGSRFVLEDPRVGDRLIAVPSTVDGRGMAKPHETAAFTAIETAQGAVFTELSDGVDVRRYRNGAAVFSNVGLAISETGAELAAPTGERAIRLIDLTGWAGDTTISEAERSHKLLYEISMAPEVTLNDRRAAYARFLIGRGFALDSVGVMNLMEQSDPTLVKNPTFMAMRGVAALLAREFEQAYTYLMAPALDSEPDAYLWRAIAAQETQRNSEALNYFERGADVLSLYDAEDQARFQLAAVRAANALGQTDYAVVELQRLEALSPPSPYLEWGRLERAKLYHMDGELETATKMFGLLGNGAPRPVEARARYHLANIALEEKSADRMEVIDRLEKLRYAWRGDAFELDLLERLSELYWDEASYAEAFGTLRQAVTYFPTTERTRGFTRTMEARFESLFLDGVADAMDPVSALALYYEFRELTPLGSAGDTMIRRLADRLVSMDLLGRAASLLDHQVSYRLEGVAQASVAARLAMVHLLNSDADSALKTLRATRASNMPKDLRAQRFQIEARALIDTGRYQEAVVTLETDTSREADMLRSDAAWGAKDWPLVRKTSDALMANYDDAPLSDDERRYVLRWAVASTLDNRPEELAALRTRFQDPMRTGLYSEAFSAIAGLTDITDGNSIPRLSGNLADVDKLEAFMDSYRAAFTSGEPAVGQNGAR